MVYGKCGHELGKADIYFYLNKSFIKYGICNLFLKISERFTYSPHILVKQLFSKVIFDYQECNKCIENKLQKEIKACYLFLRY